MGERQESQFKENLIAARIAAWLGELVHRIEKLPDSPEKLIQFYWEDAKEKVQSTEDMKSFLLAFASSHNKRLERMKNLRSDPPKKYRELQEQADVEPPKMRRTKK